MKKRPLQWIKAHSDVLANAGSLIGTTAVTSLAGFIYWWLAARWFSPRAVGIASALVSAMLLLGAFATLGLNTLLLGELPKQRGKELSLINAALIFTGCTGMLVGVLFALIAPSFLSAFLTLRMDISTIMFFATGVALTAISLVFDEAMIGLLKGELQLYRNMLSSTTKLGALILAVIFWLQRQSGLEIYATWVIGCAFSLVLLAPLMVLKEKVTRGNLKPSWSILRSFGGIALQHHLLNFEIDASFIVLPILITVIFPVMYNAWFYIAYMIASFVYIIPNALTMVLYAVNSTRLNTLKQKTRLTLGLSIAICIGANVFLFLGARPMLSIFGRSYMEQADWCLRILGLCAFPLIIRNHYVAFHRTQGTIACMIVPMVVCGFLELMCAALGARLAGLTGLSLGLLAAMSIEGLCMSGTVYRFVRTEHSDQISGETTPTGLTYERKR